MFSLLRSVKFLLTGDPWDPWTKPWHWFLDTFGEDEHFLYVWGITLGTTVVFWIAASFYLFIDITGYPKFLAKYKIQSSKNTPLELGKLWKVTKHVLVNQV